MHVQASEPSFSPRYTRLVLAVFFGVIALEIFHRQVLALVLQPMGAELGFSDTDRGALIAAYALSYGIAAPLLARVADRSNRRNLLAASIAMWGCMTALCGGVHSLTALLFARGGLGLAHSSSMPCSQSMLADYVPPQRRAVAMGLVGSGGNIGTLLGLAAWGWVAATFGWRIAFVSAGAVGIAFAIFVALVLQEPPRGHSEGRAAEAEEPPSMGAVLGHLGSLASFRHLAIGAALASMGAMAGGQWNPTFVQRVHQLGIGQAGAALALIAGVFGVSGVALGGLVADRLARRDRRWYAWVPALGTGCATPLLLLAYLWPGVIGSLSWLAVATLLLMAFGAPTMAVIQTLAPLRMRALAAGLVSSLTLLLGMGLGPQITGIISDLLEPRYGDAALSYALATASLAFAWSAIHFMLASRSLLRELPPAPD